MKLKFVFFTISIVILSSCTSLYYQVYKVTPASKIATTDNSLVFEDPNCNVYYNFWGEGGRAGFRILNKTDKNIYLNMKESFFVMNGIANDYFKNREFTSSNSTSWTTSAMNSLTYGVSESASGSVSETGLNYLDLLQTNVASVTTTKGKKYSKYRSSGVANSSAFSITYNENEMICIPPKTSKFIFEYNVTDILYRDCDLLKYPKRNNIKTIYFAQGESPLSFSNRIAYAVEGLDNLIRFQNDFYISEITNYPEKQITEKRSDKFCGERGKDTAVRYFKNVSPDKFFISYSKSAADTYKH